MPYALLPQGESLYYQVIGQGAPLILVHGNLCAGAHFAPFLPYLPKGIACYIPDLRGAGKSSYHTPLHSIDDLSEDLYALLRHLGLGPVILVGWSAGGPVCMSLALKHPDLVRAICLVESVGVAGCPLFTPRRGSYRSAKEMAQEPTPVNLPMYLSSSAALRIYIGRWPVSISPLFPTVIRRAFCSRPRCPCPFW